MVNLSELAPPKNHHDCPEARAAAIARALVCLDRSASSDACLPYARFVAEAFGAALTLLHVMPPPGTHEGNRADALEWEIARREAELYLDRARASLGVGSERVTTRLTQGFPAEQIVAVAREVGSDLTILASRGEGQGSASDMGGIAQHVLALASGSVLLIDPECPARIPPRRIMVPLDGSLRSECVLPIVADLAHLHGAEVLLLHVVTDPTPTAMLSNPDDMRLALSLASRMETNAEGYLARLRARLLRQVPVVQTVVVRRTEERQALLDVAAEHSVDMLALTAHGTTCNMERTFGSVASYLLSHARLPLFVLQDMPRSSMERASVSHRRSSLSTRPLEGE
jgi:nucleotide-binding universal stress UspA family protein